MARTARWAGGERPVICEPDRINAVGGRLTFVFRRCARCTLDDDDAGLHPTRQREVATVKELGIAVVGGRVFHTSSGPCEQSAIPGSSSLSKRAERRDHFHATQISD